MKAELEHVYNFYENTYESKIKRWWVIPDYQWLDILLSAWN